jgi:Gas vesicle protein G
MPEDTMLLIDDLLMAPVRGLLFVVREIAKAAEEESAADERAVIAELATLHRALDSGQLTEEAFDAREAKLLARLDQLHGKDSGYDAGSHGS